MICELEVRVTKPPQMLVKATAEAFLVYSGAGVDGFCHFVVLCL